MKLQTTNKQIKANFYKIIRIGYCDAQYLLNYKNPFAYTCGIYGWNADFYEIGNICISTGYRPIGEKVEYNLLQDIEKKAMNICLDCTLNTESKDMQLNLLIQELINSVK